MLFGNVYLEGNGQAAAMVVKEHCAAVRPAGNILFSEVSGSLRGVRNLAFRDGGRMLF